MTTRRRWTIGLVLAFLGVALTLGLLNSRSGPPDVQVRFIGYASVFPLSKTRSAERPVFLVTNHGSVPVQILPLWEACGRANMDAHRRSYLLLLGRVLKPGESFRAEPYSGFDNQLFRAEVAYRRLDFRHRLSQQIRSSTNALPRAMCRLLPRQPPPRWARSEIDLSYDPLAPPKFE